MAKEVEELQTKRLILRGIREEDAPEIVKWRSDPEVYRYFKNPQKITIESHLNWYYHNYLLDESRFDWICVDKQTEKIIGVFGLNYNGNNAEVNYLLVPEAQHKGYAQEAINCLISHARNYNVKTIIAEIHKDNSPSIALAERMRFVYVKNNENFMIFSREVS